MVRIVRKHYRFYYNDMNIKFIIARMFYNVTNDDILDLELYLDKYILFPLNHKLFQMIYYFMMSWIYLINYKQTINFNDIVGNNYKDMIK